MLRNIPVMIDIESCSSYDQGTLVEISAGFDGSEGGNKQPQLKLKNQQLDVLKMQDLFIFTKVLIEKLKQEYY